MKRKQSSRQNGLLCLVTRAQSQVAPRSQTRPHSWSMSSIPRLGLADGPHTSPGNVQLEEAEGSKAQVARTHPLSPQTRCGGHSESLRDHRVPILRRHSFHSKLTNQSLVCDVAGVRAVVVHRSETDVSNDLRWTLEGGPDLRGLKHS